MRGHRDFVDRAACDEFVRGVVMRRNRRNAAAFQVEREYLLDLPEHRTTDFVEEEARVSRCGTFTVRGVLYSAPSRLISHRLKVRVYSDRPDCYLSGALMHSTARTTSTSKGRGRAIDYDRISTSCKEQRMVLGLYHTALPGSRCFSSLNASQLTAGDVAEVMR